MQGILGAGNGNSWGSCAQELPFRGVPVPGIPVTPGPQPQDPQEPQEHAQTQRWSHRSVLLQPRPQSKEQHRRSDWDRGGSQLGTHWKHLEDTGVMLGGLGAQLGPLESYWEKLEAH